MGQFRGVISAARGLTFDEIRTSRALRVSAVKIMSTASPGLPHIWSHSRRNLAFAEAVALVELLAILEHKEQLIGVEVSVTLPGLKGTRSRF